MVPVCTEYWWGAIHYRNRRKEKWRIYCTVVANAPYAYGGVKILDARLYFHTNSRLVFGP